MTIEGNNYLMNVLNDNNFNVVEEKNYFKIISTWWRRRIILKLNTNLNVVEETIVCSTNLNVIEETIVGSTNLNVVEETIV